MNSVWIVTRGEYEDMRVEAVFSSEALAESYVQSYPGTQPDPVEVSRFDVDPSFDPTPAPEKPFRVFLEGDSVTEVLEIPALNPVTEHKSGDHRRIDLMACDERDAVRRAKGRS